jgi:dynactin complex subunit
MQMLLPFSFRLLITATCCLTSSSLLALLLSHLPELLYPLACSFSQAIASFTEHIQRAPIPNRIRQLLQCPLLRSI